MRFITPGGARSPSSARPPARRSESCYAPAGSRSRPVEPLSRTFPAACDLSPRSAAGRRGRARCRRSRAQGFWASLRPPGFTPIDEHARVEGIADVYAAGATARTSRSSRVASPPNRPTPPPAHRRRFGRRCRAPAPFGPLRGQLITGAESLNLRHGLTGARARRRFDGLLVVAPGEGGQSVPVGWLGRDGSQ